MRAPPHHGRGDQGDAVGSRAAFAPGAQPQVGGGVDPIEQKRHHRDAKEVDHLHHRREEILGISHVGREDAWVGELDGHHHQGGGPLDAHAGGVADAVDEPRPQSPHEAQVRAVQHEADEGNRGGQVAEGLQQRGDPVVAAGVDDQTRKETPPEGGPRGLVLEHPQEGHVGEPNQRKERVFGRQGGGEAQEGEHPRQGTQAEVAGAAAALGEVGGARFRQRCVSHGRVQQRQSRASGRRGAGRSGQAGGRAARRPCR